MNMLKKRVIVGFSLLFIVGTALSGCSKGEDKSSPSSASPNVTASATQKPDDSAMDKQLELSIASWDIQTGFDKPNAKNDPIYNDLAKKFNITIKPVQITWNDWQEKAKVWAASKQLPDIFVNAIATDDTALYVSWAKQGVIKALPDDMSAYPNLQKILSSPAVQPLKVDGKYYMIPRTGSEDPGDARMSRTIRYRKDWAAEAGYKTDPASFEEFMAMTKAVMKKHSGISGLTVNNKDFLLTQFLGSFPEMVSPNNWTKENGKWIPAFTSEKAYTGIQQLRTLFTDKILDRDFAIQKDADGVNKFLSGQSFALYGMEGIKIDQVTQFKKANPNISPASAIGYMNIWPAADGQRYTFTGTPYWSETFFPSSLSDEKFKRALQLMDYMVSDEFLLSATVGMENVDYKVENGQMVSVLKAGENIGDKYPAANTLAYLGKWGDLFYKGKGVVNSDPDVAALEKEQVDTFNKFKTEDKPTPINFDILLMSTPAKNKVNALGSNIKDEIIKVILGKGDPVAQWKDIVKGYDAKGVQDAIKEVNEEATKRGIQ